MYVYEYRLGMNKIVDPGISERCLRKRCLYTKNVHIYCTVCTMKYLLAFKEVSLSQQKEKNYIAALLGIPGFFRPRKLQLNLWYVANQNVYSILA